MHEQTPSRHRVAQLLRNQPVGQKIRLEGWVRTRRDSKGGFSFLEINDGSSLKGIQVVAPGELPNYESEILKAGTGAAVRVVGELVASQGKGQDVEVQASSVELVGGTTDDYPLQKKRHSFEYLREIAHLRPRSNTFGAIARVRNRMSFAIHEFFQQRGFYYIHTPIITSSDCEGAGHLFRVTTLDMANPPRREDGGVDNSQDFFGQAAFLTVSGQLNVESYCCALSNVYTFGPTFRAENSNTSRHLAEFWMVEPEMAFCDLEGDMAVAEDFIRHLFRVLLNDCADDLAFFNQFVDQTALETAQHIADSNFERVTYTKAIELLQKSSQKFEYPVEWGLDLQSEHERYLTEQIFKKPTILYDYPRDIKAFYMRQNDDGKTVAAMDVLVPKIGEIIGGSQREEREDVLRARMDELGLCAADYWWYLDLRRYGSVPHAGFGLGLERLIQFATGMGNIRDVIPFPRAPRQAEF